MGSPFSGKASPFTVHAVLDSHEENRYEEGDISPFSSANCI
jgi:hypothetical protein